MNTERYKVYTNKDGRIRAYDKVNKKTISYPRVLMEEKLGRPLEKHEQVHHKDGNPKNNDLDNLEIMNIGDHQKLHSRKYYDKEMTCPCCGETFIWTAHSQMHYHSNSRRKNRKNKPLRGPFCSRKCAGLGVYLEQLGRDA